MTTEQKALALVNAAKQVSERTIPPFACGLPTMYKALLAAIEAHEADKKAFSDAVKRFFEINIMPDSYRDCLSPFILPEPEPDPLVKARRQIADRVLRQFGAPASDEDCIGLIVAALEEQAKSERIEQ